MYLNYLRVIYIVYKTYMNVRVVHENYVSEEGVSLSVYSGFWDDLQLGESATFCGVPICGGGNGRLLRGEAGTGRRVGRVGERGTGGEVHT